jgi:hypothetical protein
MHDYWLSFNINDKFDNSMRIKKLHLSRPAMTFLGKCNMAYTFVVGVSLQSHKVICTFNVRK